MSKLDLLCTTLWEIRGDGHPPPPPPWADLSVKVAWPSRATLIATLKFERMYEAREIKWNIKVN